MMTIYIILYAIFGCIVAWLFKANIRLTEDDMIIALPLVAIAWPLLVATCVVSLLLGAIVMILAALALAAETLYDIIYQKIR